MAHETHKKFVTLVKRMPENFRNFDRGRGKIKYELEANKHGRGSVGVFRKLHKVELPLFTVTWVWNRYNPSKKVHLRVRLLKRIDRNAMIRTVNAFKREVNYSFRPADIEIKFTEHYDSHDPKALAKLVINQIKSAIQGPRFASLNLKYVESIIRANMLAGEEVWEQIFTVSEHTRRRVVLMEYPAGFPHPLNKVKIEYAAKIEGIYDVVHAIQYGIRKVESKLADGSDYLEPRKIKIAIKKKNTDSLE